MTKFTTEQIFDTATTAKGMTKDQTVMFHLFNPNGLVAKLPTLMTSATATSSQALTCCTASTTTTTPTGCATL